MKYTVFITIVLTLAACRQEKTTKTAVKEQPIPLSIPQIIRTEPAYETELGKWEAFKTLETQMQRFQQAQPPEYPLILEDLLRLQRELTTSPLPEKFNTPAVKSRITIMKTYLLQTQWLQNETNAHPNTLLQQKNEVLNAFNSFKKQVVQVLETENAQQFLNHI